MRLLLRSPSCKPLCARSFSSCTEHLFSATQGRLFCCECLTGAWGDRNSRWTRRRARRHRRTLCSCRRKRRTPTGMPAASRWEMSGKCGCNAQALDHDQSKLFASSAVATQMGHRIRRRRQTSIKHGGCTGRAVCVHARLGGSTGKMVDHAGSRQSPGLAQCNDLRLR